jgi:hypothetical protein
VNGRAQLLRILEDIAAQALGTVLGGGIAYLGASWLGMLPRAHTSSVAMVLLAVLIPLAVGIVALRERPSSRHSMLHHPPPTNASTEEQS